MHRRLDAIRTQTCSALSQPASSCARLRQILGVSTPSGTLFTTRNIDAHAGVERAQLLEPLALLVGRWRQLDEALQRRAAIGVEPDVVIVRARPVRGGAGESRRRASGRARPARPIDLDHVRVGALGRVGDLGGERGDVDRRVGERPERGADVGRGRWSAGRPAR